MHIVKNCSQFVELHEVNSKDDPRHVISPTNFSSSIGNSLPKFKPVSPTKLQRYFFVL